MPKLPSVPDKVVEAEKLTLNIGYVDLGRIDLLVREAFYSNRSDFIRTAIRNQLDHHEDAVRRSMDHLTLELGLRRYTRGDLEAAATEGRMLHLRVLGLIIIEDDVSPELASATIGSITVLGALQASKAVKTALAGRLR